MYQMRFWVSYPIMKFELSTFIPKKIRLNFVPCFPNTEKTQTTFIQLIDDWSLAVNFWHYTTKSVIYTICRMKGSDSGRRWSYNARTLYNAQTTIHASDGWQWHYGQCPLPAYLISISVRGDQIQSDHRDFDMCQLLCVEEEWAIYYITLSHIRRTFHWVFKMQTS